MSLPLFDDNLIIRTSAQTDDPFTVTGQHAAVCGSELHGIREVWIDGDVRLRDVRVAAATASEFVLSRLGVERFLEVGDARVRERVFVPETAPAAVCEWQSDSALMLELRWLEERAGIGVLSQDPQTVERRPTVPAPWVQVRCVMPLPPGVALQLTTGTLAGVTAASLVLALAAQLHRSDSELLKVELPVPQLTDAIEWAKHRLAGRVLPDANAWAGVASLAAGDFAHTTPLLESPLSTEQQRIVRTFWRAWTGANGDVADDLGDGAIALRDGTDAAWREFALGRARNGFRHWRRNALLCYGGEKGAWPDAHATAHVINGMVYGLLGAAPAAAHGRLRMRPQIPNEWQNLTLRSLNVGENRVNFRYAREKKHVSFEWLQETGAYPLRLIFEPGFETAPTATRVDGRNAELDRRAFGERVVTPVQLVLDHARLVEFEFG